MFYLLYFVNTHILIFLAGKAIIEYLGETIPKLKSRQAGQGGSQPSQQAAQASSGGGKKKKGKKK